MSGKQQRSPPVLLGNRGASLTTEPSAAFPSAEDASPDSRILNRNTAESQLFIYEEPVSSLLGVRPSMGLTTANKPRWYALQTHPLQEERASENLDALGVETFAPRYKEQRSNPHTGRPVYFTRSLFPRYLLARFAAGPMLRKVWLTRGVCKVVGFGDGPAPVGDEIVALIRSRIDKDGLVQLNEELKNGDVIRQGPLAHIEGIFARDIEDGARVQLLLTAVGYQKPRSHRPRKSDNDRLIPPALRFTV